MTTGAISVQNCSQFVTTNKPTCSIFTARMPFLLLNQQCQSTEVVVINVQLECLIVVDEVGCFIMAVL